MDSLFVEEVAASLIREFLSRKIPQKSAAFPGRGKLHFPRGVSEVATRRFRKAGFEPRALPSWGIRAPERLQLGSGLGGRVEQSQRRRTAGRPAPQSGCRPPCATHASQGPAQKELPRGNPKGPE
ncbi:hypothetical protein P7K49_025145, partial [Saguinus oedipus]